ncbi:MAG: GntR family transcriptional regulator [Clostridiales Family XIII bacterium]|jgi:GntR family transcriptional regulator|nr:GntR family transcriptional regulator [Clostridiales Family XIII bacterium]
MENQHRIALYEQIATSLEKEIHDGIYADTGFVGRLSDLCDRFQVSQITVRKAISVLRQKRLVYSRQGMGTFVRQPYIADALKTLSGISDVMRASNLFPLVRVIGREIVDVPDHFESDVRKRLGERCLLIRRVHSLGDDAIAYAKLYIPLRHSEHFTKEACALQTILQIYQNRVGVALGKGIQNIKASRASREHAEALRIRQGDPMLFVERFSYSADYELIEVMEMFYEPGSYYFRVELDLNASGQDSLCKRPDMNGNNA